MVAILESPAIRRRIKPLSVTVYEQLGEEVFGRRSELIRGFVLEKMFISPLHAFLVTKLQQLISAVVGSDAYCREQIPLKLVDSMPEPDLAVVAGRAEDHLRTHPTTALLAIEVAVSSLELDREKAAIYAEAGIPEYWIVVGETSTVEVYLRPRSDQYTQQRRFARPEILRSTVLPALTVDLAALFPDE